MAGQVFTPKPLTDFFTDDTSINRRKCKRVVSMKVLGLGMGRTGTTSIRSALKQLGYDDTYHMISASVENPPDALLWQDAFAAKYDGKGEFTKADWDALLGHCMAVCDWPAIAFSKELIATYPEAKVILSNRNVDAWYQSVLQTVYWRVSDPELSSLSQHDWGAGYYYPMLRKFFDTFFRGDFPLYGKQVFHEHYAEIRQLVPAENLLEYNVSEGWEPICKFLGHVIPVQDFPEGNSISEFRRRCQLRNRNQMQNVAYKVKLFGSFVDVERTIEAVEMSNEDNLCK